MKRQTLSLLLCLLSLSGSVGAQLCWKVSGNGLTKTSYLFGTHHVIDPSSIPHFDQIMQLCTASEAVVGEYVMDSTVNQQLLQGAMMQGISLKTIMSTEEYNLVDAEMERVLGSGLIPFDQMKPLFVGTLYTVMAYLKSMNLEEQPTSVDELFQEKGREKGLTLLGLESPEDQINLFYNAIPIQRQVELLVQAVREKDSATDKIEALNTTYLAGDLHRLDSLSKSEPETLDEQSLMLDQRNARWMKELPDMLRQHACFIAVGCLHLTGEIGLIDQLKLSGYTLEPVF